MSQSLVFKFCQCVPQVKIRLKMSCSEKLVNASLKSCSKNMKRDKTYTYLYVFVRPEDVRSDDLEN